MKPVVVVEPAENSLVPVPAGINIGAQTTVDGGHWVVNVTQMFANYHIELVLVLENLIVRLAPTENRFGIAEVGVHKQNLKAQKSDHAKRQPESNKHIK